MSMSPITIARALHAALEAGKHGEEPRPFFTEDAVTIERPNPTQGTEARPDRAG